ncbi:MAG: hypothetical protein RSG77_19590 [Hafnia sp.]
MTTKESIDTYFFPNGQTVSQCKSQARQLKAEYKAKGEFISYNCALNMIAYDCMNMKWDDAIKIVRDKQPQIKYEVYKNQDPTAHLSPEEERAAYKQVAEQAFLANGKLMLEDGEGAKIEMFPHNGHGLLITQKIIETIDNTLLAAGGIQQVLKDNLDFKVVYSNQDDEKSLDHEFYFNHEGLLFCYLRRYKLERTGMPDFMSLHYAVCYPGESIRPIQSALHFTEFLREFNGKLGNIVATESISY